MPSLTGEGCKAWESKEWESKCLSRAWPLKSSDMSSRDRLLFSLPRLLKFSEHGLVSSGKTRQLCKQLWWLNAWEVTFPQERGCSNITHSNLHMHMRTCTESWPRSLAYFYSHANLSLDQTAVQNSLISKEMVLGGGVWEIQDVSSYLFLLSKFWSYAMELRLGKQPISQSSFKKVFE